MEVSTFGFGLDEDIDSEVQGAECDAVESVAIIRLGLEGLSWDGLAVSATKVEWLSCSIELEDKTANNYLMSFCS